MAGASRDNDEIETSAKAPGLEITPTRRRSRDLAVRPGPPPPPPSTPPPPVPSYPPPPASTIKQIHGESLSFDFRGEVFLHGGVNFHAEESDAEARRWQDFVSSPGEIVLPIFCDGSFRAADMPSAYAISFPRLSLTPAYREVENGRRVLMGWRIEDSEGLDNVFLELLAIMQAIYTAKDEIETAAMEYGRQTLTSGFSRARPAIVKIFSDSVAALHMLRLGRFSSRKWDKQGNRTKRYAVREIARASRAPADNSAGLLAKLELHWVAAHTGRLAIHDMVDRMAGEIREADGDPSIGWNTGGDGMEYRTTCPQGVFETMEDEIRRLDSGA